MTNPFRAPDSVYQAMLKVTGGMLYVIRALGPERVQWVGNPLKKDGQCRGVSWQDAKTAWFMDGKRATVGDFMKLKDARI